MIAEIREIVSTLRSIGIGHGDPRRPGQQVDDPDLRGRNRARDLPDFEPAHEGALGRGGLARDLPRLLWARANRCSQNASFGNSDSVL